jgi:hypothetical protein
MKISVASLEIGVDVKLKRLFGPTFDTVPLNQDDINKLKICPSYKEEIDILHGGNAYLTKDIDNQYWLGIRGTGFGNLYTVGLGESGVNSFILI